jgi:8-oxo-dGTP pyrophosphatase MutT (NUDIX family)
LECALRETYEETGIDLEGLVPVSYQKLSVGEYYFFEVDEQLASPVDTREILETRWMTVDDIREAHCNVDVKNFLLRMRRRR